MAALKKTPDPFGFRPEHDCERDRLPAAVERLLSKLDGRDALIVRSRFGLDNDGRPRKFREIAETLHISSERVRQLLQRSLARMQVSDEFVV